MTASEDAQISAAVKAAIGAMRQVFGQGTNRQWAVAAMTILQHVMTQVLKGSKPEHYEVNRASFEEKLAELWSNVKAPGVPH